MRQRLTRSQRRLSYSSYKPYSVDWREQGVVTPVLRQDPCMSCSAHSAVTALESCLSLAGRSAPVPLSVQQLVDCTVGQTVGEPGDTLQRTNVGCVGGFPDVHLRYVLESGGELLSAGDYPLEPERANISTADCSAATRRQTGPRMEDYDFEFYSDEELLQSWVAEYGPAVTFVDVTPDWQFYDSKLSVSQQDFHSHIDCSAGVFYNSAQCLDYQTEEIPLECSTEDGGYTCEGECRGKLPAHCESFFTNSPRYSHSVSVVGYGTDSAGWDFWIIKNSWGLGWGEDGYVKLFRGLGHCHVGAFNSQPVCSV